MKSILSFNISISDRQLFYDSLDSNQPFQIMPVRYGKINSELFKSFSSEHPGVLIHTGYDFNIFNSDVLNKYSKMHYYLLSYIY